MNTNLYEKFKHYKEIGLRSKAKEFVQQFIESFKSHKERLAWTHWYFENDFDGLTIRYELLNKIIFPILLNGYLKKDFLSTYLIAKATPAISQSKQLHRQIDFKNKVTLLKEANNINPLNSTIQKELLKSLLLWFEYTTQYELPFNTLYGFEHSTADTCILFLNDLAIASKLDKHGKHANYFHKLEQIIVNLKKTTEKE